MFTCEIEYVYTIEHNHLKRLRVDNYDAKKNVAVLIEGGRRIRASLDPEYTMYFKTPEEAIQRGFDDLREMVAGAREEYQDALASYKVARKLGRITLEEFAAKVQV